MTIDWEQGATMIPTVIIGSSAPLPRNHQGTLRSCKGVADTWAPEIQFTVFLNLPGIDGKTTISRSELEAMNID